MRANGRMVLGETGGRMFTELTVIVREKIYTGCWDESNDSGGIRVLWGTSL